MHHQYSKNGNVFATYRISQKYLRSDWLELIQCKCQNNVYKQIWRIKPEIDVLKIFNIVFDDHVEAATRGVL